MRNILALHRARERLVLHLLLHARNLNFRNLLRRLYQRTAVKNPASSSHAYNERSDASPASRPNNPHAPGSHAESPPANRSPSNIDTHERMLRRRRMLLIVEVMQQSRAPYFSANASASASPNPSRPPPAHHNSPCTPPRQAMLHQRLTLRPLPQQLLCPLRTKLTHQQPRLIHFSLITIHCLSYLPPWFNFRFSPVFSA